MQQLLATSSLSTCILSMHHEEEWLVHASLGTPDLTLERLPYYYYCAQETAVNKGSRVKKI